MQLDQAGHGRAVNLLGFGWWPFDLLGLGGDPFECSAKYQSALVNPNVVMDASTSTMEHETCAPCMPCPGFPATHTHISKTRRSFCRKFWGNIPFQIMILRIYTYWQMLLRYLRPNNSSLARPATRTDPLAESIPRNESASIFDPPDPRITSASVHRRVFDPTHRRDLIPAAA